MRSNDSVRVAFLAGLLLTPLRGASPQTITVAAASNLMGVFAKVAHGFEAVTGIHVILSFGATANLTRQIENGAPFDVFAAADTEHIDALAKAGLAAAGTRAVYARGKLALWLPQRGSGVATLAELTKPEIRFIAVAKPELAPYGHAAVQALRKSGVWDRVTGKIVYAENINIARQYAATGNADAALTAYSLVLHEAGSVTLIDASLYDPIDQAVCVLRDAHNPSAARKFVAYLEGDAGRRLLGQSGYGLPHSDTGH